MSNNEKFSSGTPPEDLLETLKIQPYNWDVIIVGDGSGSKWDFPGGWAAVLFDKHTGQKKTLFGALSDTTVNIAELSPYLYAMQWYVRGPGKDLFKTLRATNGYARAINVHVVTDCECIAKQGRREWSREANGALWAGMDYYAHQNYHIHYHWFPRDQFATNRFCDVLSKDMRRLIMQIDQRLDKLVMPVEPCKRPDSPQE